ncbi:hypothetical protein C8F04DRAFT_1284868 [Mycena alexandri]|uniref:CxC2-like cysteine cluster KDZ transposase-associated domain-containing protein n=1 Tax=Mycena alexandri TaxID=1745969 RepID=A0AAD6WKM1_9AGAR|nr:hypothetical protein C8F04DRAFT_1284868 [Mycena alexandri]
MSKKRSAAVFTEILQYDFDDIFGDNGPSFTSQSISNDTRRTNERRHGLDVPSPMKKKAKTNHFFAEFGNDFEYAFEDLTAPPPIAASARPVKSRAKRYLSSDATLKQFVPVVDEYLAEFLRLEGKGFVARESGVQLAPKKKRVANPEYRCIDCFSPDVLCSGCCVARHKTHPLDRIEFWNGEFFERVSLKSLGLRIQMGHTGFETCDSPQPGHTDFTVVHSNGIHAVAVDFCGCENAHMAGTTREQTLRMSWFPATDLEPQTCATFRVVELFHILTLQGKVTTYDFYSGLEKLTDNAGLLKLKDRYKSFMRIMREWRHLVMTMPGELGPDCPGCPRPKVNIPDDWESATEEQRFLVEREEGPEPGSWVVFFTEDAPYREYLLGVTDQKEMSTCSGLAALDYANTKFSRGYGSTGVGLGVCARHEYANMDYIFASLMRHHDARLFKFISYDICCQWSKHLIGRLKKLPARIRLTLVIALVRFLIPKLHIYGHKIQCQLYFSLNYTPGSARTDGEGIERPWANIGPVATSTREMGPGSRQDTLNDHWSHWNWQKLVGAGGAAEETTFNRYPRAKFSSGITGNLYQQPDGTRTPVEGRRRGIRGRFDEAKPIQIPKSGASEHDVRLECAQEEAADQVAGIPAIHNVSPSAFILAGLDLEEQQRQIKIEVLTRRDQSTKQSAELVEKRTKLSRPWLDRPAPSPDKEEEAARVENVPLFLPSALTEDQRATGCNRGVVGIETRLRDAQCRSALDEIRNLLHVKSRFRTYKGGNKLRSFGEKYVAAWEAKRRLVGEANVGWRRLNPKKDLRCMESEDDAAQRSKRKVRGKKRSLWEGHASEGRRTVSWIWMGVDSSSPGTSEAILTGLRAEWAKAWARTRRWTEEVTLLKEEMRRVPVALRWKAEWWRGIDERIAVRFELMWEGLRELEEVQSASAEAEGQQDEEERDDDEKNWVAAESEGEGGIEGEDEEGSIGEGDDEGDDED